MIRLCASTIFINFFYSVEFLLYLFTFILVFLFEFTYLIVICMAFYSGIYDLFLFLFFSLLGGVERPMAVYKK